MANATGADTIGADVGAGSFKQIDEGRPNVRWHLAADNLAPEA